MKPYTTQEKQQALKRAFAYLYSFENLIINRTNHKKYQYDKRTRIGSLTNSIVTTKQLSMEEKARIIEITRNRKIRQRNTFNQNYTTNPLWIDYKNNKNNVKTVTTECIYFYGRNHWAKNETDKKVLAVLRKHFLITKKVA